jgi:hypothetical protein
MMMFNRNEKSSKRQQANLASPNPADNSRQLSLSRNQIDAF